MQRLVCAEWGWGEYRDAVACLACGRQDSGGAVAALLDAFAARYPGSVPLPVNRGRFALTLALRAFARLRPGKAEVVYPAYICASVIEAIEAAGLVPVPADIGLDLNMGVAQAARVVGENTLAVVAVHIYGCPAPVAEFHEFCRARRLFLIDDAACLVGIKGEDEGGRMLGAFGDAGVISFTASKSIVAGGFNAGGLLLVNNPELEAVLRCEWATLPAPRFRLVDFLLFLRDQQLETYSRAPCYYWSAVRRRLSRRYDGGHVCPPSRIANISALLATRQLGSLDRRIAGRIRIAEAFHQALAAVPEIGFPQYRAGRYLTRIVLQLPPGAELGRVRAGLRRLGIETRRGYGLDLRHGSAFPRALALAPQLIEVPSHSRMDRAAIERVCAALGTAAGAAAVTACRSRQPAAAE